MLYRHHVTVALPNGKQQSDARTFQAADDATARMKRGTLHRRMARRFKNQKLVIQRESLWRGVKRRNRFFRKEGVSFGVDTRQRSDVIFGNQQYLRQ